MQDDNSVHPMFRDASAKLSWAHMKLNGLRKAVSDYPYGGVRISLLNPKLHDGKKIIRIDSAELPFPCPPYVGDIMRNFRGSLDHASSAMLRAVGKRDDKDYFPIGDTTDSFRNYVKLFLEKCEAEKLTDFFLNDVDATKEGKSKYIWYLNQMDRANKHRQLVVLDEFALAPIPDIGGGGTLYRRSSYILKPGTTTDIEFPEYMNIIPSECRAASLDLKFGQNEIIPKGDVIETLTNFEENVRVVLKALQKEYLREYPQRGEEIMNAFKKTFEDS